MGEERGCFPLASPFVDTLPILPSVEVKDSYQGRQYSPSEILEMYDCLNTPQPWSNQCFGSMPYDATYMASSRGQGAQAKGWLEDPYSPVRITSQTQPVAVGTDMPSAAASDRNPHYRAEKKESFVGGIGNAVGGNDGSGNAITAPVPMPPVNPTPPADTRVVVVLEDSRSGDTANANTANAANVVTTTTDVSNYDKTCKVDDCKTLFPCVLKTVRAFLYDVFHPDAQPEDEETLSWLFRHHRLYFLGVLVVLLLAGHLILGALCPPSSVPVLRLYWCAVLSFFIYMSLPPLANLERAQALTSLFIFTVALWAITLNWNK